MPLAVILHLELKHEHNVPFKRSHRLVVSVISHHPRNSLCIHKMPRENLSIHLAERPVDDIIPGKTFEQRKQPIPSPSELKDGEILVETLYLSLDPAMRGWLDGKPPLTAF